NRDFTGLGSILWSGGKLATINANINAGTNQLTADIKPGKQLAGSVNVNAPDLSMLWPGLQGALETSITLSGSPEQPQAQLTAEASSVSLGSHSLETLTLSGELQSNSRLTGNLVATGLVTNQQQLGKLDFSLAGTLAEHQSSFKLSDGIVDVELRASGVWQDGHLTQSFNYGQIQPDGLNSWQLKQNPQLRLSAGNGKVSAHCWQQQQASICIDSSNWSSDSLQSKIVIDDFALATLQPLLTEAYNIDGTVDADISIMRNTTGLQAELHWRQSQTLLTYTDDIDEFQTKLDEVQIDLLTNDTQTNLTASLTGEQGLNITATAKISGPLAPESPLKAAAKGSLPNIDLLRPLLQRVVNPGELLGELSIDLDVAGTLAEPVFTGGANLTDGSLQLLGAGITLSGINITTQSEGSNKLLLTGELHSGDGSAKILGEIEVTEKTGLLADIHIQGQNLASVRVPDLSLDSSPDLRLRISKDVFDISGTIKIPRAMAQIRNLPKNAVPRSPDVIVHAPDRAAKQHRETIVTGDIEVLLGDQVRFNSFGL
ncbi:MAG: translocation/assembly module TamB domain-containing protein, partial [Gammaproteobacteria bacterium]|nr:translocation/assembly module TamB domain-containing protein [Gammaproteobacteria bacterium]